MNAKRSVLAFCAAVALGCCAFGSFGASDSETPGWTPTYPDGFDEQHTIAAFGDSITAGSESHGDTCRSANFEGGSIKGKSTVMTYPYWLSRMVPSAFNVISTARPEMVTDSILGWQGSVDMRLVESVTLPKGGGEVACKVWFWDETSQSLKSSLNNKRNKGLEVPASISGWVNGHHVTYVRDGKMKLYSKDEASVMLPAGAKFVPDFHYQYADSIQLLFAGHNDGESSWPYNLEMLKKAVATIPSKRFIVITSPCFTDPDRKAAFINEFGADRYLDCYELLSTKGIQQAIDLGLLKQSELDHLTKQPDGSYLLTDDLYHPGKTYPAWYVLLTGGTNSKPGPHMNALGHFIVARALHEKLVKNGWIAVASHQHTYAALSEANSVSPPSSTEKVSYPKACGDGIALRFCTAEGCAETIAESSHEMYPGGHAWVEASGECCNWLCDEKKTEPHDEPVDQQEMGSDWGWSNRVTVAGQDYCVLAFTNTAATGFAWTVPEGVKSVDYLVVGGGGGGGGSSGTSYFGGGGGGAGWAIADTATVAAGDVLKVVVGAGGAGGAKGEKHPGSNGGDSSLKNGENEIAVAQGGGGGGASTKSDASHAGLAGGCGGGGGVNNGASGAGNPGFAGGKATNLDKMTRGGGGGGATGPGANGSGDGSGGDGGAGLVSDITGASATYAQGGTGGGWIEKTSVYVAARNGADGTGNGGDGANDYYQCSCSSQADGLGGRGGNGVVIIRYAVSGGEDPEPPSHTHIWDGGSVTREATCVATGVRTFHCSGCAETRTEEIAIDPGNHLWATDPYKTEGGYAYYKCTREGCAGEKQEKVETPMTDRPLRVLVIGNSFSKIVLDYLPQIAKDLGVKLDMTTLYRANCALEDHWAAAFSGKAPDGTRFYNEVRTESTEGAAYGGAVTLTSAMSLSNMLAAVDWDIVTMHEYSGYSTSYKSPHFQPSGGCLAGLIRALAPNAEIRTQLTWSFDMRAENKDLATLLAGYASTYTNLVGAYTAFAKDLYSDMHPGGTGSASIIPVGNAVQRFRRELPIVEAADDLTAPYEIVSGWPGTKGDYKHLSSYQGRYLHALVWAGSLFGRDVTSVSWRPDPIDADRAVFLRRCAAEALSTADLLDYGQGGVDPGPGPDPEPEPLGSDWGWSNRVTVAGQDYCVLAFTNTAAAGFAWTVPEGVKSVDYLVVGGGGGGGGSAGTSYYGGGGGGAGWAIADTATVAAGDVLKVVVGAGGAGGAKGAGNRGETGRTSSLAKGSVGLAEAAGGGGGGASKSNVGGLSGACGGGGGVSSGAGGAGNPGFAGGKATNLSKNTRAGGGGGATGPGANGSGDGSGGEGGAGLVSDITGASATYAQGGTGGGWIEKTTVYVAARNGADGTGNGGDGANDYYQCSCSSQADGLGGRGGNGVVIIRYAVSGCRPPFVVPVVPGEASKTYATEEAALAARPTEVTAPVEVTEALSAKPEALEAYVQCFEIRTRKTVDGQWVNEAVLTEPANAALQEQVDKGIVKAVSSLAGETLTLSPVTPGFYYALEFGETLQSMERQRAELATDVRGLTLDLPKGLTSGFYRVIAGERRQVATDDLVLKAESITGANPEGR